jgi:flagellar biosynthetic protein FliP
MKRLSSGYTPVVSSLILYALAVLLLPEIAIAAQNDVPFIAINTASEGTGGSFGPLKIALLVSSIVFIPSIIITVTCFPRIAIVLSMTRQALGTAQTPPNQLIMGLALFLTFSIMGSTLTKIYEEAVVPFSEDQLDYGEAFKVAFSHLRDFMLPLTREEDLALFADITNSAIPENPEELSATIVIPAFVVSELSTAFQIAFLIYMPFLILDMVISSVLTSMSMITLPPTVISLPIKLMLFVVIDGWSLIIGNLVNSYHM